MRENGPFPHPPNGGFEKTRKDEMTQKGQKTSKKTLNNVRVPKGNTRAQQKKD